jgi:hypothetical protein
MPIFASFNQGLSLLEEGLGLPEMLTSFYVLLCV